MSSRLMFDLTLIFWLSFWQVEKAHDADLHCVDWNPHDVNFILTGYLFLSSFAY
jgi:hypothetical protein